MLPSTMFTYPLLTALGAILMPFLMALVVTLISRRGVVSGFLVLAGLSFSLFCAGYTFSQVWGTDQMHVQWDWFTVGEKVFQVGVLLDNLSVLMLLLVPLIAVPVVIYSYWYMKYDPRISRYWAYLSLFCGAMMGLVVADSLLLMYVFWELVGFASYLLIGFWFTKDRAAAAAKKAFLFNRVGDLGFLVAISLLYIQFGTLDTQLLFGSDGMVSQAFVQNGFWVFGSTMLPEVWLTITGGAFFLAAMAKSAQFPMHVWLPDAMEGPTSASSLIHAATMVAAGVFLLARVFPVFDAHILWLMTVVGVTTTLLAAFFALTQFDIKKILAFSTISQLGLMVAAIGMELYNEALFHLVTHAFFKCLLFLSAGSVIHYLKHRVANSPHIDTQDIRNMGDFRMALPFTFILMTVGAFALVGVPFTSGFLSKDAILVGAFEWAATGSQSFVFPVLLSISAVLTAFYTARMIIKVFLVPTHFHQHAELITPKREKESMLLWIPMALLALGALFPWFSFTPWSFTESWVLEGLHLNTKDAVIPAYHTWIPIAILFCSGLAVMLAWQWYFKACYPFQKKGWLHRLSYRQLYVNAVYGRLVVLPIIQFSRVVSWIERSVLDKAVDGVGSLGRILGLVSAWLDRQVVDGTIRFLGKVAYASGNGLRRFQNGNLQYYLFLMFFVMLTALFIYFIR